MLTPYPDGMGEQEPLNWVEDRAKIEAALVPIVVSGELRNSRGYPIDALRPGSPLHAAMKALATSYRFRWESDDAALNWIETALANVTRATADTDRDRFGVAVMFAVYLPKSGDRVPLRPELRVSDLEKPRAKAPLTMANAVGVRKSYLAPLFGVGDSSITARSAAAKAMAASLYDAIDAAVRQERDDPATVLAKRRHRRRRALAITGGIAAAAGIAGTSVWLTVLSQPEADQGGFSSGGTTLQVRSIDEDGEWASTVHAGCGEKISTVLTMHNSRFPTIRNAKARFMDAHQFQSSVEVLAQEWGENADLAESTAIVYFTEDLARLNSVTGSAYVMTIDGDIVADELPGDDEFDVGAIESGVSESRFLAFDSIVECLAGRTSDDPELVDAIPVLDQGDIFQVRHANGSYQDVWRGSCGQDDTPNGYRLLLRNLSDQPIRDVRVELGEDSGSIWSGHEDLAFDTVTVEAEEERAWFRPLLSSAVVVKPDSEHNSKRARVVGPNTVWVGTLPPRMPEPWFLETGIIRSCG